MKRKFTRVNVVVIFMVLFSLSTFAEDFIGEKKLLLTQMDEIEKNKLYLGMDFALIAGATIAGSIAADEKIREMAKKYPDDGIAADFRDNINELGTLKALIIPAAGYMTGMISKNEKLKLVSMTSFESLAISLSATGMLKILIGRARPYEEKGAYTFKPVNFNDDWESFPSGHSTIAWALITPYAVYYNNPWLYLIPTGVSMARIFRDEHWTSDVVAGGAISFFIAYNFSKYGRENIEFSGNSIKIKF